MTLNSDSKFKFGILFSTYSNSNGVKQYKPVLYYTHSHFCFIINSRVKRIIITQPFNKIFISLLCYYFFYSKYLLLRLLKFLFVKRTLNFLSVIISYFICHWNCQFNFRNFENLFRQSFSVFFIKIFALLF